jgi:plastocyanin
MKGAELMTTKLIRMALAFGLAFFATAGVCAAGSAYVVDQKRQRFSISRISILTDDVVRYINGDDVRHNIHVIAPDGTEFDKGLQDPGQTIEMKFDRYGVFVVRCTIHQTMKMKVEVR